MTAEELALRDYQWCSEQALRMAVEVAKAIHPQSDAEAVATATRSAMLNAAAFEARVATLATLLVHRRRAEGGAA